MLRFITEIEEPADLLVDPQKISVAEHKVIWKLCGCGCGRLFKKDGDKRFVSEQHSRVQHNRDRRKA